MFWAMAERQMMMVVMAAMTMRGSVMAWRWDPPFLSSVNDPALMIIQIIKIIITTLMMIFQTKVIIITIVVKLKSKDRQHIAKRLNLNQYLDAMRMQIWHIKKIQAKKTVHGQRDTCKQGHWPTDSGLGEAKPSCIALLTLGVESPRQGGDHLGTGSSISCSPRGGEGAIVPVKKTWLKTIDSC